MPFSGRSFHYFLLALGLAARFFWCCGNGLSLDEITSLAFVHTPNWTSSAWDNYPPTFYLLMKIIRLASEADFVLRLCSFLISGISFVVFYRWLTVRAVSAGTLVFWSLNPLSIISAGVRPTVWVELAGIVFFISSSRSSFSIRSSKDVISALALLSATFLAPLGYAVSLSERALGWVRGGNFARLLIFALSLVLLAATASRFIDQESLHWLKARSPSELLQSSGTALMQFWGYSYVSLTIAAGALLWSRRMTPGFATLIFICLFTPLLTGFRLAESRFLIFANPVVIVMADEIFRSLDGAGRWLRRGVVLSFFGFSLLNLTWFLKSEKSGWPDALQTLQNQAGQNSVFMPVSNAVTQAHGAQFRSLFELQDLKSECPTQCDLAWSRYQKPRGADDPRESVKALGFEISNERIFGESAHDEVTVIEIRNIRGAL